MKRIALVPMSVILTACGYTNTDVVEYRQVSVAPVVTTRVVTTPVVTKRCCTSVITTPRRCCPTATTAVVTTPSCCGSVVGTPIVTTPVVYDSVNIVDTEPVDVTTTSVEYY
ncbi:hypothetical protein [Legionella hackeliae]|uniref:Uncharacterized protein n=1 Tax=Legionella hackeliae TaxID=449 RepID=A0A0A8UYM5_LEGHA|nr:hypothetical protein [Legionella hackeliae]KTD12456.1 hypothetical protein Lhac_1327 [Legionella hackeliae]CEK11869.1 exported protein of unknown function [Legionella hackeliae]STX48634.1 Uncharacterised protein [Legionella hackeliae]